MRATARFRPSRTMSRMAVKTNGLACGQLVQRALAADQLVMVDHRLVSLAGHRPPAEDVIEERTDLVHALRGAISQEQHAVVRMIHDGEREPGVPPRAGRIGAS